MFTVLESVWPVAALELGLALLATLMSIRLGIVVGRDTICVGTVRWNLRELRSTEWFNTLTAIGSVLPTSLAEAQIDLGEARLGTRRGAKGATRA